MSVGFLIGIKYKNGMYKFVECASGIYPEDSGRILYFSYDTKEKVETLLSSGFTYLEDYAYRKYIKRIPQWVPEQTYFLETRKIQYLFDEKEGKWKTSDGEDLGNVLKRYGLDSREQYEKDLKENPLYRGWYTFSQLSSDVQRNVLEKNRDEIEEAVTNMFLNRAFFLDDLEESYGIAYKLEKNRVSLKLNNEEKKRYFLKFIFINRAFFEDEWSNRTNDMLNKYIRNCNLEEKDFLSWFGITSDFKFYLMKDTDRDEVLYVYDRMDKAIKWYKTNLEEKIFDVVKSVRQSLPECSGEIVRYISLYFDKWKKIYFSEKGEELIKNSEQEETISPSL